MNDVQMSTGTPLMTCVVQWIRLTLLVLCSVIVAACTVPTTNFSQYPGFATYWAAHPRQSQLPSESERALLERHAPRFFLPPGHAGLLDFYTDYIASGRLYDGAGQLVASNPNPADLNALKHDTRAEFVHVPRSSPTTPVVLARLDRAPGPEEGGRLWTFLTYHAVFRHSGLPAGVAAWQELGLRIIANVDDWHQLDHYTAVSVALDAEMQTVAVTLQQHNGLRTYLCGRDLVWPADGRVAVDVAIRSNELYPHTPRRMQHRAVGMPTPQAMRFLITGQGRPFFAADDITEGVEEVAYRLDFVPHDDAFYTFAGFLGERRRLRGRSGPPGADYNTLPANKGKVNEMLLGYWREGDADTLAALDTAGENPGFAQRFAALRRVAWLRDVPCIRLGHAHCACTAC